MPTVAISIPMEILERVREISKNEKRNVSNVFVYSFCKTYGIKKR